MKRTKAIHVSIVKSEYVFENLTYRFAFKRSSKKFKKMREMSKKN